jgi:threonine/homoserine/homoserine lactone efflux protein
VLAVIIALLYLLYGGIKWVTSGGDKTQVENARNHITAAVTGLIIVFLAIFVITIVLSFFGLNVSQLVLPKISP